MMNTLKIKKKEANEAYRRAILLKGHTAGKNALIEATGLYYKILTQIQDSKESVQLELRGNSLPEPEMKELEKIIILNLAACSLQLDSFDSCIRCCDSVLEIEPLNEKALYRKGNSLFQQHMYQEASEVLKHCLSVNSKNKSARSMLKECTTQLTDNKDTDLKSTESWKLSTAFLKINALEDIKNGSKIINKSKKYSYIWGQTLLTVDLVYLSQKIAEIKDISVSKSDIKIVFKDDSVFMKKFWKPIDKNESTWQYETDNITKSRYLRFTLYKAQYIEQSNILWWKSLFFDDDPIDVSKCKLPSEALGELPEDMKREWKKNIETGNQTISEEEQNMMSKMKKDINERENRKKKITDPKKKQFLKMMSEKFPDIPVDLR